MFVFIPQGGLCNRMRSLDSAIAISKAAGIKLNVEWYLDPNLMSDRLENLFEIPPEINKITTKNYMGRLGKLQKTIQKRLNKLKYKHCLYEKDLAAFINGGGDLVDLAKSGSLCIASCKNFYVSIPKFENFKPKPVILDEVQAVFGENDNVIGVHIRRDDHLEAIRRSPIALFESTMNEEIKKSAGVKFFLATDSTETQKHMINLYGDRIIMYQKTSLNRDDVAAIRDAMIDLYALSRSRKIIGSYGSSFSDVAAQINQIDLVILDNERNES